MAIRWIVGFLVTWMVFPGWLHATDDPPRPMETMENPYLAPADLSTAELAEYLERMQQKPAAVRSRPGFEEALLDAADRVLSATPAEQPEMLALLVRFDVLTRQSQAGDAAAHDALVQMAQRYKDDARPKIAAHVQLCLLELRASTATDLAADEVPRLLSDLKDYCAAQTLTDRHLKLASHTIRAINMLPKAEERNPHFSEFGKLFAKSADRKLARYGRDLAQTPGGKKSELAGQVLQIEGQTAEGLPFDWASYRGKVVLVDFWATWCGPCRAELPYLKRAYEKYHDRGFEVVGISLDQDLETLKTFLAEEQIAWTNLFDEAAVGWDNPIAALYGVKAIPTCLLVDREGKVVSTSARGVELERQLARLLDGAALPAGK